MMEKNKSMRRQLPYLPEHLVMSIFEYLPAKSLLKFCLLSKTTSSSIHESSFLASHLKHYPKQHQNVLLHFAKLSNGTRLRLYNGTTGVPYAVYDVPHGPNPKLSPSVIGYSNGIICLSDSSRKSFSFWNPPLGKILKQDFQCSANRILFLGFGYDYSNNHCKLVCVFEDMNEQVTAQIYAVSGVGNTSKWKICSIDPPPQQVRAFQFQSTAIYVNKVLYWLKMKPWGTFYPISIFSFHIEDEVFQEFALPRPLLKSTGRPCCRIFIQPVITELNGMLCACLSQMYLNDPYTIWVMKEHGNSESWVPLLHIDSNSFRQLGGNYTFRFLNIVGIQNNGEELWVRSQCECPPKLLDSKTLKVRHLEGMPECCYFFAGAYRESLVFMDVEDEDGGCRAILPTR